MTNTAQAFVGADIFDGTALHTNRALVLDGGKVAGVLPLGDIPETAARVAIDGGTLAPGFVDIQVNGGGGILFNDAPSLDTLRAMAKAHARLGATSILPTLITDTPAHVRAAVEAVEQAVAEGVAGIAGLHLEGPHLSLARKGAHDPALIRPMEDADLAFLLEAVRRLPVLKVTVAPESVTPVQMRRLADAGVLLALGHSDASHADCVTAAENGVRCVTHLFNAMSQLTNREPGLVGAALDQAGLSAGLIADLIHVHPATLASALRAKRGPGRMYLVSDAMATAGSEITHFTLNGRRINRQDGRLTLEDGTLAGADLDLATAVRNVVRVTGLPLSQVLAMATSVPATLIGQQTSLGHLRPGARADLVHLDTTGALCGVWQGGARVAL
ncbi:N-acetylglucosamine-6-phosphate deacetylase [Aliiroseovarius subalbicans]|uniref:N-acetylglucosamine-6-phosphate deacetylase n=1 Tax=Aliiroseovarius subalbicans TaxID=2925840 RepID=UPI001F592828|nr:N-acetylglucosamine-6-phosphate deacetylase [Aliiroseovarius subalbicans]MCI2397773.1 N-acetylglucosamine-6-phosphate deacetylase [Aliiroseovarius subalbicans]